MALHTHTRYHGKNQQEKIYNEMIRESAWRHTKTEMVVTVLFHFGEFSPVFENP